MENANNAVRYTLPVHYIHLKENYSTSNVATGIGLCSVDNISTKTSCDLGQVPAKQQQQQAPSPRNCLYMHAIYAFS